MFHSPESDAFLRETASGEKYTIEADIVQGQKRR